MRKLAMLLFIALFALTPLFGQATVVYQVKDLGVLPGWNTSRAITLNWLAQTAGSLETPTACHAFLWNALTGMKDIGTVKDNCARGQQVDALGRVAGGLASSPSVNPDVLRTFFYGLGGPMIDIGSVYGNDTDWSVLQQMNSRAEIVGYSHRLSTSDSHAFYWSRSTGIVDLHPLAPEGAVTSVAHGISDSGRITGHTVGYGPPRAFYMQSRTSPMIDLTSLDHFPVLSGGFSMGLYINSRNQIVGEYKEQTPAPGTNVTFFIPNPAGTTIYMTGNLGPYGTTVTRGVNDVGQVIGIYNSNYPETPAEYQSFRWTAGPAAPIQVLQPLAGGDDRSAPSSINNLGQVVGVSYPSNTAVLWKAGSAEATALPPLEAGMACYASKINDLGVISGACTTSSGQRAVIWQARLKFGL